MYVYCMFEEIMF